MGLFTIFVLVTGVRSLGAKGKALLGIGLIAFAIVGFAYVVAELLPRGPSGAPFELVSVVVNGAEQMGFSARSRRSFVALIFLMGAGFILMGLILLLVPQDFGGPNVALRAIGTFVVLFFGLVIPVGLRRLRGRGPLVLTQSGLVVRQPLALLVPWPMIADIRFRSFFGQGMVAITLADRAADSFSWGWRLFLKANRGLTNFDLGIGTRELVATPDHIELALQRYRQDPIGRGRIGTKQELEELNRV